MDITTSVGEVVDVLARAARCNVVEAGGGSFKLKTRWADSPISLTENTIAGILDTLRSRTVAEQTVLFDATHYETLVREESGGFAPDLTFRMGDEGVVKEDAENQITYRLGRASDEYITYIVLELLGPGVERQLQRQFRDIFMLAPTLGRRLDRLDGLTIFDVLRRSSRRLTTLQIESKKPLRYADFTKFANAFIFQLSFNLDIAFIPLRSLDELARRSRIAGMRRSDPQDLEAPKRFYNPDLIHRYQHGVASDSALLQYLSYYHIAEHFFEAVFNDDLIERVRTTLTHPGFSHRRKRDIQDLVKTVRQSLRSRGEEMTFDELNALRLTLLRYVSIEDLRSSLEAFDQTLMDYYAMNEVNFSGGDTVDLSSGDEEATRIALSKRIYKTRNAIVHSKEGLRGRYTPFQHDRTLLREVPWPDS